MNKLYGLTKQRMNQMRKNYKHGKISFEGAMNTLRIEYISRKNIPNERKLIKIFENNLSGLSLNQRRIAVKALKNILVHVQIKE